MFVLGTDFRVSGVSTEAYIKSIDVKVPDEMVGATPIVKKTTPPTDEERR